MESTKPEPNINKEKNNKKKIISTNNDLGNQNKKQKNNNIPSNKKLENNNIINNKNKNINVNVNGTKNLNQKEILSEINNLKKELELKGNLINKLISEVNKQNLELKDYDILEKTKNELKMSFMHSEEEIKQLKEELNKVNKEKEELKKTITNLNSELNMEKIKTSNLNINNEELNNKIAEKSKFESKYDNIENINNDLTQKIIDFQKIIEIKEKDILSLKNFNKELSLTNDMLNNQLNEYKLLLKETESSQNDMKAKIESNQNKVSDILQKNIEITNENILLKNKNDELIQENRK